MQTVKVDCRSEYTYAQDPLTFCLDGETFTIQAIVKRWREPDGLVFKVQTTNARSFKLKYRESEDTWLAEELGKR
jgi:hypothetical protein